MTFTGADYSTYCLIFARSICVAWKPDLAVWEILLTVGISILTIAASIWVAFKTANASIERSRVSDRIERRGKMLIYFADYCAACIKRVRSREGGPEDITAFSARLFAHADEDEFETLEWMRDAVAEIVTAAGDVLKEADSQMMEFATKEEVHDWVRAAANAGQERFAKRLDELRGWVRTPESWENYLLEVGAEDMIRWYERT